MNKFNKIKNIIFDLGNVVLDIDLNITIQRFKDMGWNGDANFLDKYHQKQFFGDYEQGLISTELFLSNIKEHTRENTTDEQIKNAWNALLLNYKTERIQCIIELKQNYRVFLLSNTNQLHIDACSCNVPLVGTLSELFNKTYYSFEMNMRKPDANIYEAVLKDSNLKAEETLFLDDSLLNVNAAKSLGIESWLVDNSDLWVQRIREYLL